MRRIFLDCLRNTGGNAAIAFALALVPIVGATGIAIDYSRAYRVQADLQYSVDAAALAGAAELSGESIEAAVDAAMSANFGDGAGDYDVGHDLDIQSDTVTVTANATVPTTIGAIFLGEVPVSASATAFHGAPVRIVDLQVTEFNSNAWDANSIYWYIVPEDGGVPAEEDLHLFLSNDPDNPAPEVPGPIQIGVNQQIGFALVNVTGGIHSYGNNSFGQPPGSVNRFYSHLAPENLHTAGHSDCTGGTVQHGWDDNGGGVDDNDFDDAVYEFSCQTVRVDPTTVFLLR
jgi:Flp pilus assembly protein TadG